MKTQLTTHKRKTKNNIQKLLLKWGSIYTSGSKNDKNRIFYK